MSLIYGLELGHHFVVRAGAVFSKLKTLYTQRPILVSRIQALVYNVRQAFLFQNCDKDVACVTSIMVAHYS